VIELDPDRCADPSWRQGARPPEKSTILKAFARVHAGVAGFARFLRITLWSAAPAAAVIGGNGAAGSAIWNQEGMMEQTGTQGRMAFVYGPVKRGGALHHRLAPAELVGAAVLPGFRMFQVGAAPCIIPSPRPDDEVRGEVWRISEHQLRILDLVEGGAYRRTQGVARLEDGSRVEVVTWAWAFSEFGLRPIPSGDWDVNRRRVIRTSDSPGRREIDERAS
jgi:gamma-glutamylcyclotransferase (GGCT)/AIG2-like uncharacterized protein YtfP